MSWQHLGETFDIHGGGIDLVFPHHENEIAQSRCAFGHQIMAQVWMHNGHLQVEGEKMSKSLGNFVTIRDLWNADLFGGRRWSGDALRLAMLRTHYRQPIDFTIKGLEEADRTLVDFGKAVAGVAPSEPSEGFLAAMTDDLNTPKALAELFALRGSDPGALAASLVVAGDRRQWRQRPRCRCRPRPRTLLALRVARAEGQGLEAQSDLTARRARRSRHRRKGRQGRDDMGAEGLAFRPALTLVPGKQGFDQARTVTEARGAQSFERRLQVEQSTTSTEI